jgi:hypothetical protein
LSTSTTNNKSPPSTGAIRSMAVRHGSTGTLIAASIFIASTTAMGSPAVTNQAVHSTWRLGTGDEQYRWVNRAVFVGEARLLPGGGGRLGMRHNVYRLA